MVLCDESGDDLVKGRKRLTQQLATLQIFPQIFLATTSHAPLLHPHNGLGALLHLAAFPAPNNVAFFGRTPQYSLENQPDLIRFGSPVLPILFSVWPERNSSTSRIAFAHPSLQRTKTRSLGTQTHLGEGDARVEPSSVGQR